MAPADAPVFRAPLLPYRRSPRQSTGASSSMRIYIKKGGSISRVLYPFRDRRHLSCPWVAPWFRRDLPANFSPRPRRNETRASNPSLLGLARNEACRCRPRCRGRGGLLPHHFTLTMTKAALRPSSRGILADSAAWKPLSRVAPGPTAAMAVCFCCAVCRGSPVPLAGPLLPCPGFNRRCALVSPDFPPRCRKSLQRSGDAIRP